VERERCDYDEKVMDMFLFCWKNQNHAQTMVISDLDTYPYPRSLSFPHHSDCDSNQL